jgi:asparagine synthase (glutamine-hydrolysing)
MCGITGFVDFSSKIKPESLGKMIGEIVHRGPDSSGKYFNSKKSVGLGVRRLSIIDLATGDQPISNENGSINVVFNGEIYNYKNLRRLLIKKGHKFKTKSDTEVLVHLYEEYKEDMPKYLNGMFTFAIWDDEKQKLFIARDRVGIKPLYYFQKGKSVIFGSEIKSILKNPLYEKAVDLQGLRFYFYLGYIPGTLSIFQNIKKLPAGNFFVFTKSGIRIKKYFELDTEKKLSDQELGDLIERSVKMQLHADVPVGVFLSGGLDSSLIAYYVSKFKKLKSFSISFREKGFDEASHAYDVAKTLGTQHHSEEFIAKDVINSFDEISSKLDEPLADASLFPTYKVSKLAKRYVKVVLSGDGGDELFGGYPTYQAHILARYLDLFPSFVHQLLSSILEATPEGLVDLIPYSFKDYSKKRLAKIVLDGLRKRNPERHLFWMRTFFLGNRVLLEKPNLNLIKEVIPNLSRVTSCARKGQIMDFYTYLPDDFLVKVDRASMYNSLEVRVPYLDNDIIDFVFSTKDAHVNLFKTKILFKKILQDKLPKVAKRPKKGFGLPLQTWLRGELKDFAYSHLENEKLYDFIPENKIRNIWSEHQKMEKNNAGTIWMLIVFSGWLRNWL